MRRLLASVATAFLLGSTAGAEEFELDNGDKIDATVIEEDDDRIVVEHPQLGRIEIPRSALKPPAPPSPGLFGTSLLAGWSRNVGLGFSGSSGNSSDASFNASLALTGDSASYRGALTSSYFYASQEGQQTTNEFNVWYQHDFLFSDAPYYAFAQTRYQYDAFQAWKSRVSSSAGMGLDLVSREGLSLRSELGAGFARSWGSERGWRPEGVASLVLEWVPTEGQKFTADVTYYPDFASLPEYRVLANVLYSIAIAQLSGLSLQLGIKEEYDSDQPGDNNNLKYFGNLVYSF